MLSQTVEPWPITATTVPLHLQRTARPQPTSTGCWWQYQCPPSPAPLAHAVPHLEPRPGLAASRTHRQYRSNSCQPTVMMHKPTPVPACLVPLHAHSTAAMLHKQPSMHRDSMVSRQPRCAPPVLCQRPPVQPIQPLATWAPQHASPTTLPLLQQQATHTATQHHNHVTIPQQVREGLHSAPGCP